MPDPQGFTPDPKGFTPDTPTSNPIPISNQEPGVLGKAWNFLTTSPFVEEPTMEERMNPVTARNAAWRSGVAGMTSPLAIGGELLGGIGALRGINRLRNLGKVGEVAPEIKATDMLGSQAINEIPKTGMPAIKPKVRVNLDGTFTNLDTGEILNPKVGKELTPPQTIKPMFNPKGQTGMTGNIQGPPVPPDLPPPKKDFYKDPIHNEPGKVQQVYDLSRGMMSVDLPFVTSAAFRQAGPMVGTKYWFKGWANAARAFRSEDIAGRISQNINEMPLIKRAIDPDTGMPLKSYADKVGLRLSDLDSGINAREEALRGQLAEKIPLYGKYVRASNRAYTSFLNTVRSGSLQQLVDGAKAIGLNPEQDLTIGKGIADFINDATGRGTLSQRVGSNVIDLEQHTKVLSNLLFSPRSVVSKIHMLDPQTYIYADPFVRKQYLKAITRQVGLWWGMAGLAELAGASVSKNPTSADFGKIRLGNTRIDPPGGLQQFLVLGARMAAGGTTSTTGNQRFQEFGRGGPYDPTYGSTLAQFGENRLHPTLKLGVDLLTATKKQPFHTLDRSIQALAPMYADDFMAIAQEDPEVAAIIGIPAAVASSVGMGAQSYERGSFGKPVYVPENMDLNIPSRR